MKILSVIRLMRPFQWAKNVFVALPLFFSGSMLDPWCWRQTIVTIIAYSLMASSIYCLNDIRDVDADRSHPRKRHRPIASGTVGMITAKALTVCLIVVSLACCLLLGEYAVPTGGVLAVYLVLNIAYCLKLKQYAIVDVFIVSFGFVLRLLAGGIACHIWLSPWIVCMTFLLALFLAFAKRRDDVVLRESRGVVTRGNTTRYNLEFLNQTLSILGAVTIVCYIIYAVSPEVEARMESHYVYLTSVFVLAGILRYLQVAIVFAHSGSPTKILLHDRFIRWCIVLWLLLFFFIIYV